MQRHRGFGLSIVALFFSIFYLRKKKARRIIRLGGYFVACYDGYTRIMIQKNIEPSCSFAPRAPILFGTIRIIA